ncbi:MAG TPA: YbaK/EbsC family protein [Candidatus Sulfotelmatobacter sp.]|nr:YbaK/EbsC family protein [Candidatus Sulfotelmatobacter sp.]
MTASSDRPLSASAQKVQDALRAEGLELQVIELAVPVRTAADAAREVGCEVGQIVKSLIFRAAHSDRGVLVLTSGANRVNEARITELLGEPIERAHPDFVRQRTGFAIGGVPPIAHVTAFVTFIDEDLLRLESLWAAAGHPNSLFELRPADLTRLAHGTVTRVT